MATLTPSELLGQDYEPIQKHRFVLYIDTIPTWLIKRVKLPDVQSGEVELPFINVTRYVKGKTKYSEGELELFQPISPSGAQYAMEWIRLAHNQITGADGFSDAYKKDLIVNALAPDGTIVNEWKMRGAWVKNFTPGEFDYASEGEQVFLSLTLRCDYIELNF